MWTFEFIWIYWYMLWEKISLYYCNESIWSCIIIIYWMTIWSRFTSLTKFFTFDLCRWINKVASKDGFPTILAVLAYDIYTAYSKLHHRDPWTISSEHLDLFYCCLSWLWPQKQLLPSKGKIIKVYDSFWLYRRWTFEFI